MLLNTLPVQTKRILVDFIIILYPNIFILWRKKKEKKIKYQKECFSKVNNPVPKAEPKSRII